MQDKCSQFVLMVFFFVCLFGCVQATGPFLQFGAVGALTLLSPFVFQSYLVSRNKCTCPIYIYFIFLKSEL